MTQDDNVVALPGFQVPVPRGVPNEAIVESLRDALAMAESGQLVGLGLALVIDDNTTVPVTRSTILSSAMQFRHLYFSVAAMKRHIDDYADAGE